MKLRDTDPIQTPSSPGESRAAAMLARWGLGAADARRLVAARALRSLAYGLSSVLLAIMLRDLGLSRSEVGDVLTAALVGGIWSTAAAAFLADRLGRRRLLLLFAGLMAAAGGAFAVFANPWALGAAALLGTISPTSSETAPFLSLEQAILPQVTPAAQRTDVFARYNLVALLAVAGGALLAGLPGVLAPPGPERLVAERAMFAVYAALAIGAAALFWGLSPAVELAPVADVTAARPAALGPSRGIVLRLAGLFALDALGGGFAVQSILALWFHERFALDLSTLGGVFLAANLASALSLLVAPRLAARFGLVNTMVFTHLPSNLLLMAVPFMPTAGWAVAALLARQTLSQMDVPTRQAYTMQVVTPAERPAAAGVTSIARSAASAAGPTLAGRALEMAPLALGLPFLLAGGLKIVYDLSLWAVFRRVGARDEA
ncbi:MAG TPA: MFS transporter [Chloroflexia bacterium]|nr:MFS transporter [Chloroflexia bacterium]